MAIVTRGFGGRRRQSTAELPPGQYLTADFPVLTAGPTQYLTLDDWSLTVTTETGARRVWTWTDVRALPVDEVEVDLHCVTRWSKLRTRWRGVPVDAFLEGVDTTAAYAMAESTGGYTTNLPLVDLTGGRAWVAFEYDGRPLAAEHGGPVRLLVPHLYLWKSAKWLSGLTLMTADRRGFWENFGYHSYGDPWREQRYAGD